MSRRLEYRGCPLAYEVTGGGAPILFVQGVGVCGSGWRPQVEALAREFLCVTLDNRGMGASHPAGSEITVERMADDALALLDAEEIESAHVVGHSLGGAVALELALAARGRVRSLALLCTFTGGRTAAPFSPRLAWWGARSRLGSRRMRRRGFLGLVLPPGRRSGAALDALAAEIGELFGHDLADLPPVAAEQLRALRRYDASDRLAALAGLPTLVVAAAHDPIAPPRAGRVLAAGISGARYVEIPDASHGLPITHAERINAELAEHLRAVEARA